MIKIFPSPFSDPSEHDPIYSCAIDPGETLLEALLRLVPSYDPARPAPWQCKVNGLAVEPSRYALAVLGPDTNVDFFLVPRGDIINTVLNIFTLGTWNLVMKFMTPKVAKERSRGSQDRDDMDMASAKGNIVKLGGTIREKFGEGRIYPDHLVQLRRYFVTGAPTRQAVEMFLSLGRGRYLIDFTRSRVGETLQAALGANFEVQVYEPGADVSGQPMADNWFTSAEVGGTSSGTAGLDLTVSTDIKQNSEASTYTLSSTAVAIPSGAGSWPTGWAVGMTVRALTPYTWTVTDGGVGVRDRISGPWAQIAPVVGMKIEVDGGFSGEFVINSVVMAGPVIDYVTLNYANGSAVTALPTGSASLTVGFKGLRFKILTIAPQVMTLQRLTDTGSADGTWPGFDALTTSSARFTLDSTSSTGGWSGPFAGTAGGALATQSQLDFFYPAGLYRQNKYGNADYWEVTVEAQYRDANTGGAWTAVQYTHSGGNITQIGFTHTVVFPSPIVPEWRVRRITVDSDEGTVSDQVQWYGLKSKLIERRNSYADMTTVAVRVFGGGALAAQAEQMVSFWATRILPKYSGGVWLPAAPTRSIADAALYVAKDRGYSDNRLDLAEWDRLGAIWDARGDYFDGSFEKETTAEAALNLICRPGYAQVIAPRGILRPVRDALRGDAEKEVARLYSTSNSRDIQSSGQPVTPNDTDGINVKYLNPETWATETIKCRLPEIPNPRKITELTLEGVNDETRAWRLGMRELCGIRYRRWKRTWTTGLDSFASAYMDYAELCDDVPDLAINGQLRDWNGVQTYETNEPIGDSTVAAFRRPDGTKFGPFPITSIDGYMFTMAEPLDFTPITEQDGDRVPTHVFFGHVDQMFWPVLISSVQPSSQYGASVEALGYDERVYQFDDSEPPADA